MGADKRAPLLPGPDGRGRVRKPVTHRRSDLPKTFGWHVESAAEPDVELVAMTREQDELMRCIIEALIGTGPGRLAVAGHFNGEGYLLAVSDVRHEHVLVNGKRVERVALVPINTEELQPEPPSERGPVCA